MNKVKSECKVVEARVFPSMGMLTFEGVAPVVEGQNEVAVDCMVAGIMEDSIRVKVPKEAELDLVRISHEKSEREGELEEKIKQVQDELEALRGRAKNRELMKELLSDGGRVREGVSLPELADYLTGLPARLDDADASLAEVEEELKARRAELEEAKRELKECMDARHRGQLVFVVDVPSGADMPFKVEANVQTASWRPVYDLYMDDLASPLRLRLRAEVSQRTGMDWHEAKLSFGTLDAVYNERKVPTVASLHLRKRIDFREVSAPAAAPAPRAMKGKFSLASMDFGGSAMEEPLAAAAAEDFAFSDLGDTFVSRATKTDANTSRTYQAPGTWDVASSDADVTMVELETRELEATYKSVVAPVAGSADAVLVARLEKPLDVEDAGHDASIHLEGSYAGRTRLGSAIDGGASEISLGLDPRFVTSRRLVRNHTSKALLGGKRTQAVEYEITVTSTWQKSVKLVVLDRIPVSDLKEVVVEASELSGGKADAETGIVTWELEPEPGETKKLRLAYTVSLPKDVNVDEYQIGEPAKAWRPAASGGFCPTCGSRVEPGAVFCLKCGARIEGYAW